MWMYYFWTNITYRQSIFRFKHEGRMRKSQSQDSLGPDKHQGIIKFKDKNSVTVMLVTDLRCWWQNHYVGDLFRYVGDLLNVLNRSLTSQTCHQQIWSPTFVTNIDVTLNMISRFLLP